MSADVNTTPRLTEVKISASITVFHSSKIIPKFQDEPNRN